MVPGVLDQPGRGQELAREARQTVLPATEPRRARGPRNAGLLAGCSGQRSRAGTWLHLVITISGVRGAWEVWARTYDEEHAVPGLMPVVDDVRLGRLRTALRIIRIMRERSFVVWLLRRSVRLSGSTQNVK